MTRPRCSGSTHSCTEEFAMAWKARLATPIATSAARNVPRLGASAAAVWARPKATAIATRVRRRVCVRPPATSAPATEPTAITTLNRP
jgi:hypothetical protein